MKKVFAVLALAVLFATCAMAQVNLNLGGLGGSPTTKKPKATSKMLTGTVADKSDQPIIGAVVYLKNSKSLTVKSYFTQQDGSYRFPQLALNTDYEIWAEKDGKKSDTKRISQFDDRSSPTVNLRIDLNK